jgi:hypothetical protein
MRVNRRFTHAHICRYVRVYYIPDMLVCLLINSHKRQTYTQASQYKHKHKESQNSKHEFIHTRTVAERKRLNALTKRITFTSALGTQYPPWIFLPSLALISSSTAFSPAETSREQSNTRQPALVKALTVSSPMPLLPPVCGVRVHECVCI